MLSEWLSYLEQTALAVYVRESLWAYPALETLHIIGIGLVFGSILAFDLRVLGVTKALPLKMLERHLLPWVWFGFVLNTITGALMFASDAVDFSSNLAFQAKLGLLVLAGLNAWAFTTRLHPALQGHADVDTASPASSKYSAALSIILWLGIITAGRMMAYLK
jgi:hypothetical protein